MRSVSVCALVLSAALGLASGCTHTTELMDVSPSWSTEPGARFFLVGTTQPELVVPPNLLAVVMASIRGGLGERGHTARTGFASADEARRAMRGASCDEQCVLVEVELVGFDNGGSRAARALLTGAGGMSIRLVATFTDHAGQRLTQGELDAHPYQDEASTRPDLHIVPTIGPAFADAITEDD